jgi:uncharacterized protein (DUF1697 family)
LRGINVGGRTIKMADLKSCLQAMGFEDVTTILQTGNVVFRSSKRLASLKPELEAGLTKTFDYPAKVHVYTLERLQQIIDGSPFDDGDPERHSYVIFFEDGLEQQLAAEATDVDSEIERIQAGKGVLYWQVPKGQTLKTSLGTYLTKARYKNFHTNRNLKTLRKITGIVQR